MLPVGEAMSLENDRHLGIVSFSEQTAPMLT
jgi:hypothetical protein